MKVIGTGKTYRLFEDNMKTYDELPIGTYVVRFHKMMGFYFERQEDFSNDEKIYGAHMEKTSKIFKSYHKMNRSMGVILSGDKGIGKSLFARLLGMEAYAQEMPVIIVSDAYYGIDDFIESIEQEVMVFFDEFEKIFKKQDKDGESGCPQEKLLGLFDGLSQKKKLYVVTCNNIYDLSDYIVNRTGRFHYHLRFDYPTGNEVKTYLEDSLDKEYYSQINNIVLFASKVPITYDTLRSIAFEINLGYTFEDSIKDLNIKSIETTYYSIQVYFKDDKRKPLIKKKVEMNLFGESEEISFEWRHDDGYFRFNFDSADAYLLTSGQMQIDGENVEMKDYNYDEENWVDSNLEIDRVLIRNVKTANSSRYNYI